MCIRDRGWSTPVVGRGWSTSTRRAAVQCGRCGADERRVMPSSRAARRSPRRTGTAEYRADEPPHGTLRSPPPHCASHADREGRAGHRSCPAFHFRSVRLLTNHSRYLDTIWDFLKRSKQLCPVYVRSRNTPTDGNVRWPRRMLSLVSSTRPIKVRKTMGQTDRRTDGQTFFEILKLPSVRNVSSNRN